MNRISCSTLVLSILTLASCGGGGEDNAGNVNPNASTSVSAPVPPQTRTLASVAQVIEYYGDSTIEGVSNDGIVAKPAPSAFAETLPAAPKHEVRNEGVSGTTACQLLNGTDGRHQAWDSQMASSNATVVIINHAINDLRTETVSTYQSCLRSLAKAAKNRGKRVILETPNPVDSSGLEDYAIAMKQVASEENIPVIDQYANLKKSLDDGTRTIRQICPDGTHPSADVYIEKGRYAAGVFVTLPL